MDVEKKLYNALKPYLTTPLYIPKTTASERATPETPRTPTTSPSNRSHSTRARSLSGPSSPNSPIIRAGVRDISHRGCQNFRTYLSDRRTQRVTSFQSLKGREREVLIDLLGVDNRRSLLRAKKRAVEGKAKWLLEHEKTAENDAERLSVKAKRVTSENRAKWIAGELEVLEKERRLLCKEKEVGIKECEEAKDEKQEGEWEWGMMEE